LRGRPIAAATVVAACALAGATTAAGGALPAPWQHVPLNASKPQTRYTAVALPPGDAEDEPAIQATATGSASVAIRPGDVDLQTHPVVAWRWRVRHQPDAPDLTAAAREDAAARLVFFFDGDRSRLPWTDRLVMAAADKMGSRPLPFATLMYVSAPGHATGQVFSNPYTRRIRMLVVDSDPGAAETSWRSFRRNLREDFRRSFGEEPGRLIGWGLMTDSDNTRSRAETVYGRVRFEPAP
jgi:hypothetical protein